LVAAIIAGGISAAALTTAAIVAAVLMLRVDPTARPKPGLSKDYIYDLAELRKVDPKLILYDAVATIRTGFEDARAIAVDADGRIAIAADSAIHLWPRDGLTAKLDPARTKVIKTERTPLCLAWSAGRVYAGVGGKVEIYDDAGDRQAVWDMGNDKAVLTSIAVSEQDVFVADAGNRLVLHYERSGKLIGPIGRKDPDRRVPGFIIPSPYFDLAMAPDGLLRVANPGRLRIEAYTTAGDMEFSWGRPSPRISGFSGCCNPVNFAVLPDGRFVTCEKGLRRVKLYDAEGKFLGVVAPPSAFATDPPLGRKVGELDVAVGPDGRILVLDPYTGLVKVFAAKSESR